ncbi:MAG: PorP/SprF family type IX secretion system membrane protein [Marinirhabdus sp.]
MKHNCLTVLVWVLFATLTATAQQDPQYTQYAYNLSVVNPAYAGTQGTLSFALLYRKQWSGIEGAPSTITFSGNSPVGEKSGIGVSFIRDRLGPVQESNVYADYSYTLNLDEYTFLSLGIKAGLTFHEVGLANLDLTQEGDPLFAENIGNNYPNIGAGAYYYNRVFYAGLSVPNFLRSVHLDANGIRYGAEVNHFFFVTGFIYPVNENFTLKPSFLFKTAFGAPLSVDINMITELYERFQVGFSYRLHDSFSGLVGFRLNERLRIGYAHDRVISDLRFQGRASHEAVITYDLEYKLKRVLPVRFN